MPFDNNKLTLFSLYHNFLIQQIVLPKKSLLALFNSHSLLLPTMSDMHLKTIVIMLRILKRKRRRRNRKTKQQNRIVKKTVTHTIITTASYRKKAAANNVGKQQSLISALRHTPFLTSKHADKFSAAARKYIKRNADDVDYRNFMVGKRS